MWSSTSEHEPVVPRELVPPGARLTRPAELEGEPDLAGVGQYPIGRSLLLLENDPRLDLGRAVVGAPPLPGGHDPLEVRHDQRPLRDVAPAGPLDGEVQLVPRVVRAEVELQAFELGRVEVEIERVREPDAVAFREVVVHRRVHESLLGAVGESRNLRRGINEPPRGGLPLALAQDLLAHSAAPRAELAHREAPVDRREGGLHHLARHARLGRGHHLFARSLVPQLRRQAVRELLHEAAGDLPVGGFGVDV